MDPILSRLASFAKAQGPPLRTHGEVEGAPSTAVRPSQSVSCSLHPSIPERSLGIRLCTDFVNKLKSSESSRLQPAEGLSFDTQGQSLPPVSLGCLANVAVYVFFWLWRPTATEGGRAAYRRSQ